MADEKKQPQPSDSLIGGILKDCFDTILVPKSKEILTNMMVDGVYAVADFVSNVAQRRVWKNNAPVQSRRSGTTQNPRTAYSTTTVNRPQSTTSQANQRPQQNIGMRSSQDLQYVVIPANDQQKAEDLKNTLIDHIQRWGKATVAELYEGAGTIQPIFTDYEYGWTRVGDIHYVRNRDGYCFNLPKPEKITDYK